VGRCGRGETLRIQGAAWEGEGDRPRGERERERERRGGCWEGLVMRLLMLLGLVFSAGRRGKGRMIAMGCFGLVGLMLSGRDEEQRRAGMTVWMDARDVLRL
jgi:hypothetical protein